MNAYRLIAPGTVEEKIWELQQCKSQTISDVLGEEGFISVFANTMYDMGKAERGLGGKSFAIITDNYLNFNSRLGYHFGMADAYISEERNDNYISFQFKGGAAAIERRSSGGRISRAWR